MTKGILNVAVIGMGFGSEFAAIYSDHPDVASVTICDADEAKLADVSARLGLRKAYLTLEEVLADRSIDAVHIATPVALHAQQVLAVLKARKHCACAVPMATSFDDLHAIIEAQKAVGVNYMMMETAVYSREFFMIQELYN
ncbi:Gfo/Idh/MocA family protein, partial [Mesorhizobium sp. BHbdii]